MKLIGFADRWLDFKSIKDTINWLGVLLSALTVHLISIFDSSLGWMKDV